MAKKIKEKPKYHYAKDDKGIRHRVYNNPKIKNSGKAKKGKKKKPIELYQRLKGCVNEGLLNYKGLLAGRGNNYKIVARIWNDRKTSNVKDICDNIDLHLANIIMEYAKEGKEAQIKAITDKIRKHVDISGMEQLGLTLTGLPCRWWEFQDVFGGIVSSAEFLRDRWKISVQAEDGSTFDMNCQSDVNELWEFMKKNRVNFKDNYGELSIIGTKDYVVHISIEINNIIENHIEEYGIPKEPEIIAPPKEEIKPKITDEQKKIKKLEKEKKALKKQLEKEKAKKTAKKGKKKARKPSKEQKRIKTLEKKNKALLKRIDKYKALEKRVKEMEKMLKTKKKKI